MSDLEIISESKETIEQSPEKDNPEQKFYDSKYRYVTFISGHPLKLKAKTQIAYDMQNQFKHLTKEEINKELAQYF